jgi:hypothetical protein
MTRRAMLLIRNHDVNVADTLVPLTPPKPPLLPCTAWEGGAGRHFWQRASDARPRESDRCWYCLQSRHASRDWPLTLERALEGD